MIVCVPVNDDGACASCTHARGSEERERRISFGSYNNNNKRAFSCCYTRIQCVQWRIRGTGDLKKKKNVFRSMCFLPTYIFFFTVESRSLRGGVSKYANGMVFVDGNGESARIEYRGRIECSISSCPGVFIFIFDIVIIFLITREQTS